MKGMLRPLGFLLLPALLLASCGANGPQDAATPPAPQAAIDTKSQIAYYLALPENQVPELQDLAQSTVSDEEKLQILKIATTGEYVAPAAPSEQEFMQFQQSLGGNLSAQDYHGISSYGKYLYIRSIATGTPSNLEAQRKNPKYSYLNWSNDGCSLPWYVKALIPAPSLVFSSVFNSACKVHDFGYRNVPLSWRAQADASGTLPYNYRLAVDDAFLRNMKNSCSWWNSVPCNAAAYAFYKAVRWKGGSSLGG